MRGDRRKQQAKLQEPATNIETSETAEHQIDIRNFRPGKIPSLVWRECIKKIWEVDPLICTKCGGEMRRIAFIYERAVIEKILRHLGLFVEEVKGRGPPVIVEEPEKAYDSVSHEPCDDGWPEYEEASVDVNSL